MSYLGRKGASAALTSADIPDNSITAAKISPDTIVAADLAPDSVDSSELVDGSVDLSHMSANSVDSEQYVDGSIDSAHLHTNAVFASGTKMIFNQTAAPTGWTKVTSSNDVALRLVSGTVGTGGSVAFETAFASQTPTITMSNDAHTLTIAQMPSHTHTWTVTAGMEFVNTSTTGYIDISGTDTWGVTGAGANGSNASTGGGGTHTHDNTAASSAINLDVSYVDVIIATKD